MNLLSRFLAETPKITAEDVRFPEVSLGSAVTSIINFLLTATGILSVLFIVIGAFLYTTSNGDPARLNKAKETLLYAIIGLIVTISAVSIIKFVTGRF